MARGNPEPWFRQSRKTWYVTIDGHQHNLQTDDKQEAWQRWHELMAQPAEAETVPSTEMPVISLLALFCDWSENHNEKATYEWYRNFLQSFLETIPRALQVKELKPFHVTRWLDANKDWGGSGRRGAVTAVKRAFNWAVEEGYIGQSPVRTIKRPKAPRRETLLTAKQKALILKEAPDQAFKDFLVLLQETGARPQEVRVVEARHVDLKNGLWIFPPEEHKTGAKTEKPRVVYLTDTALEVTKRLVCLYLEGPICRNSKGNPWTSNAIRCRFRRLRERLSDQLPENLCAYLFRHAFVTQALENGVDPITLAELAGHQNPAMISSVYQHLDQRREHLKESVAKAMGQSGAE